MPQTLKQLSTLTPASTSRSWMSTPHSYLPLLATASSDKTVRIYSLTSFTLLSTITGGHKRSVRTCAWRPGGAGDSESTLATGSFDASAGIWRCENRKYRRSQSDDDAAGEDDNDNADEEFRFAVVLEGHDSEIKSVAWSCHGTFLATCSRDKSVWIWEALEEGAGATGGGFRQGDDDDNFETVAVLQEHEGDVKCVAWHPSEQSCLASGSYDETVRIWREDIDGEWVCVGLGEGHKGTVWSVDWEPFDEAALRAENGNADDEERQLISGPRIISCSDDLTIRIWTREPKAKAEVPSGPRIPSIIRSGNDEEEWHEEAKLPQCHERTIYSVAWSKKSRKVVSCGSDGKIVVYEEHQKPVTSPESTTPDNGSLSQPQTNSSTLASNSERSSWIVVAEIEAAHGVFEVNHVCWSRRYDSKRQNDDEEVIISTGDDGEVKVWTLESS